MKGLPAAALTPAAIVAELDRYIAHLQALRAHDPPVVARGRDGRTLVDLRTVEPADDDHVTTALLAALAAAPGDGDPGGGDGQVAS